MSYFFISKQLLWELFFRISNSKSFTSIKVYNGDRTDTEIPLFKNQCYLVIACHPYGFGGAYLFASDPVGSTKQITTIHPHNAIVCSVKESSVIFSCTATIRYVVCTLSI